MVSLTNKICALLLIYFVGQMTCCGSEGLFPGADGTPHFSTRGESRNGFVHRGKESLSMRSNDLQVNGTSSYEGTVSPIAQRKRPLAVAVGFKYAEDMNGRPIVITPGTRRIQPNSTPSPTSSPASQSSAMRDLSHSVPLPCDQEADPIATTPIQARPQQWLEAFF